MPRVCPLPDAWNRIAGLLREATGEDPPQPLVLEAWFSSPEAQKRRRWEETVEWASARGLRQIIDSVPDDSWCTEADLLPPSL